VGRVEEARVRDHAQELAQAEDGDRPERLPLGELAQPRVRGRVLGELFAVGVDEDVRVDGDQRRPSMRS
jgi:hypothetical protein